VLPKLKKDSGSGCWSLLVVKDVQAPVGRGESYVDDGQRVEQGERLISLEPVADQAQLASLKKIALP